MTEAETFNIHFCYRKNYLSHISVKSEMVTMET